MTGLSGSLLSFFVLSCIVENTKTSGGGAVMAEVAPSSGQRIVIIGGGFGGVFAARALRKKCPRNTHIELINATNYFVFQPLLPEVASGVINAQDAVSPQRSLLSGIKFRLAEVMRVDLQARKVFVLQGQRHKLIEVAYDQLVLATGLQPNLSFAPGLAEHSLTMKTLADAFHLRNHVIECLEWADVTDNEEHKRRALTFVVAGGGFSGVETMGEIEDMVRRALRYYPSIQREQVRFVIVQRGDRLLPELPESLGHYTEKEFKRRGIETLLDTGVSGASRLWVRVADKDGEQQTIPAMTLVTTIGNGPTDVSPQAGELERGRLKTDSFMHVQGQEGVWALGDAAQIPCGEADDKGKVPTSPPTAQFAVQQAEVLAQNLAVSLGGKGKVKAFNYRSRGSMASLGAYRGVAEVMGLRFTGLLAWFLWRGFYIMRVPGFVSKVRVTLNWMLDYIVPRTIVTIEQRQHSTLRFAHYRAGDVLFEPGEILDGFYLVLSGKLEVRVKDPNNPDSSEELVKVLNPQDHMGDRIRRYDTEIKGVVRAVEDTRVMIAPAEDLTLLRESFTKVDAYLKDTSLGKYPEKFYATGEQSEAQDSPKKKTPNPRKKGDADD